MLFFCFLKLGIQLRHFFLHSSFKNAYTTLILNGYSTCRIDDVCRTPFSMLGYFSLQSRSFQYVHSGKKDDWAKSLSNIDIKAIRSYFYSLGWKEPKEEPVGEERSPPSTFYFDVWF